MVASSSRFSLEGCEIGAVLGTPVALQLRQGKQGDTCKHTARTPWDFPQSSRVSALPHLLETKSCSSVPVSRGSCLESSEGPQVLHAIEPEALSDCLATQVQTLSAGSGDDDTPTEWISSQAEDKKMLKASQVYPAPEHADPLSNGDNPQRQGENVMALENDRGNTPESHKVPRLRHSTRRQFLSNEGSGFGFASANVSSPPSPEAFGPGSSQAWVSKSTTPVLCPAHSVPGTPVAGGFTREPSFSDRSKGSFWSPGSSGSPTEPEPSIVAAKLKKAALENPPQEQSIEDLLSSMGVSSSVDPGKLDYSIAVEFQGPPISGDIPYVIPLTPGSKRNLDYSIAVEFQGPPVSGDIPYVKPMRTPGAKLNQSCDLPRSLPAASCSENESPALMASKFERPIPVETWTSSAPTVREARSTSEAVGIHTLSGNKTEISEQGVRKGRAFAGPDKTAANNELISGTSSVGSVQEELILTRQANPLESVVTYQERVPQEPQESWASKCTATSAAPVGAAPHLSRNSSSSDSGEIVASPSPPQSIASSLSGPIAVSSYGQDNVSLRPGIFSSEGVLPERISSLMNVSFPRSMSLPIEQSAGEPRDPTACKPVKSADNVGNRPVTPVMVHRRKGGCYGCGKGHLLQDKEVCMVCSAKYCSNCVLSAMGSMPEGRKCVGCIGEPIHALRRSCVGKPSRLLKHMLSPLEVQQILKAERECPANQLRPEQVIINGNNLSLEEMAMLLGCEKPPLKLKPGRYWYDGHTGLWGKEGYRPDRIISPSLKVGGLLHPDASKGTTQVYMNNRELGKLELKMLKFAGVNCTPNTHLWVEHDGNYVEEGFKNVKGNIWGKEGNILEKASIKLLYPFFSLPTPGSSTRGSNENSNGKSTRFPEFWDQSKVHKLLLLGHEGSGRSTIFKQAKILYRDGFTEEEKANFKSLILANIFKYVAILLDGRERFEEEDDDLVETRRQSQLNIPSSSSIGGSSDISMSLPGTYIGNEVEKEKKSTASKDKNIYCLETDLKQLSNWFMENMANGTLEAALYPLTPQIEEYAKSIQKLWLHPSMKATFKRKSELHSLPDVANYFLDRVVEVSRSDYEPLESDVLQTEGLSQGSGLVQVEFTLEDKVPSASWQDSDPPSAVGRYQLIRVGGKGMFDRHRWLDMFEDVRAVVFCVALSEYDLLWPDSSGTLCNKMIQTRDLFESILKHPCFQDTPFVLLLNKYDIFQDKIYGGVPLTACEWFSDFSPVGASHYTAQNQAQQAYQYIAHKYKEMFNNVSSTGRKLFTFQLSALDKTTVSGAFQYVREILKWEEHRATGWDMIPDDLSYSTEISSYSQHSIVRQPGVKNKDGTNY